MTSEITVTRKVDKVVLKTKGVVVTMMDPEEAMKLAQDLMAQADKVLAATNKGKSE